MRRRLGMLCLAAVLAGCGNEFRSLNPIALPDDRSPVPGLAGDWAVVPIRSTPASTDSVLVVTASTAEIRRFIGRYQARTNAIDHEAPITLRRLR